MLAFMDANRDLRARMASQFKSLMENMESLSKRVDHVESQVKELSGDMEKMKVAEATGKSWDIN